VGGIEVPRVCSIVESFALPKEKNVLLIVKPYYGAEVNRGKCECLHASTPDRLEEVEAPATCCRDN